MRYLTDKIPLVFEYERKDSRMTVDRATILCELKKTHAPIVFLDKAGTRPLPPAEFISKFQIVITTTQRFMHECKHGSFQDELEQNESGNTMVYRDPFYTIEKVAEESCELLKVYWNRLVVDEGHSMGKDKTNSTIQFASWVNAKNRWAMTGTPTKQSSAEIHQLKGLMTFLQHGFFTSRGNGDVFWKRNIGKAWAEGHLVSFFRLRSLLQYFMTRHTKMDIAELPSPSFTKTAIPMSCLEATTYKYVCSKWAVAVRYPITSISNLFCLMLSQHRRFRYPNEHLTDFDGGENEWASGFVAPSFTKKRSSLGTSECSSCLFGILSSCCP